jgi:hypothetical protein
LEDAKSEQQTIFSLTFKVNKLFKEHYLTDCV